MACGDAKKENWRTTKLFLKHVSETLFMGKKIKENFFSDGKSRGPLLAGAALKLLFTRIYDQKIAQLRGENSENGSFKTLNNTFRPYQNFKILFSV